MAEILGTHAAANFDVNTSAVRETDDLVVELVRLVTVAAAGDTARTGRRCRLRDSDLLSRFLSALLEGRPQTRAAIDAGLSEAVVRLWLKRQDRAVYALFRQAVTEVLARRAARPFSPIQHAALPAVERSTTVLLETAPYAPPAPPPARQTLVPLAHRQRWWNQWTQMQNLGRLRNRLANEEAHALRLNVTVEMWAFGLVPPPTRPET